MISQSAEYALRAVVSLAHAKGERVSTARLAERTKVPPGYLPKVLQALAKADLVTSVTGRIGGFQLARDPARITVLDVVDAIDPVKRIESCPLELDSHRHELCPLHRRLDEAAAAVERAFAGTTIAEILGDPSPVPVLCAPP
ncbi:MAG: Rrf2 family transcriptional regulator [Candidatus Latescibacteria bacterium]|nr:Rrf2 family transcriptional regulator [Candidatus Latescibacterota bacterium]